MIPCPVCSDPRPVLTVGDRVVCSTSCQRALSDPEARMWAVERLALGDARSTREIVAAWDRSTRAVARVTVAR